MKYTTNYFKKSFPVKKKKNDSLLLRFIIRPISFFTSSIFANLNLSANQVSLISLFIAFSSDILLFINNHICRLIGCCLLFLWLLFDCTDGNIARGVKKEKFGDFMDASSGYFLLAFLYFSLGKIVFDDGGIFFVKNNQWALLAGGLFSICDILARLLFQKFKNNATLYSDFKDESKETTQFSILRKVEDRIEKEIGIDGLFIPLLLLSIIFSFVDIVFLFYGTFAIFLLLASSFFLFVKVFKKNKSSKI